VFSPRRQFLFYFINFVLKKKEEMNLEINSKISYENNYLSDEDHAFL
jgi:hypothetical protein